MCPSHLSHDPQCENVHFVGSYFLEHLGILKYDGHGGDGRGRPLCRHCSVTALACLGQALLGFTWLHEGAPRDIGETTRQDCWEQTFANIQSMFSEKRNSEQYLERVTLYACPVKLF